MGRYEIISFNFVKGILSVNWGVLCICMMVEIKVVLAPLLAFTSIYDATKVCNMLALILDPWFKSLNVLKTFIERAIVIQIVTIYIERHGSQIETKRIFNVLGVLTSLWHYRLGVDNMDKLVMIMKKWLVDVWSNCPWIGQLIIEFLMEKVGIIEENDVMLDVVGCFNIDHELAWWIKVDEHFVQFFLGACLFWLRFYLCRLQWLDVIVKLTIYF